MAHLNNLFANQSELDPVALREALTAGAEAPLEMPPLDKVQPTDYGTFVLDTLARMRRTSDRIDQSTLRQCIRLASSFLLTDTTMNPEKGIHTWSLGFNRLVDIVVAIHGRNELELATICEASRTCSECWMAAGGFRGLEECRNRVRENGIKLKKILDPNGITYKGETVYAP